MVFRDLKFLVAAAVLACSLVPAATATASDTSQLSKCRKPIDPRVRGNPPEEGISLLAFLIQPDGKVGRVVILGSSGFDELDNAAAEALSKCVFRPATVDGKGVESWVSVQYVWSLPDDEEMRRARHDAAQAAVKGDLAARYRLSQLLFFAAKTDTDRELALAVLRSAADQGHAHAQYSMGVGYEQGRMTKVDIEEALRWYHKAAAQGDVLAIQRLQTGKL